MQAELNNDPSISVNIEILAINQIGASSGISSISPTDILPVVEDDASLDIWNSWGGTWRDVLILNQQNEIYATYNLTQHNLAPGNGRCSDAVSTTEADCQALGELWTENYDYLKALFISAATE